MRSDLNTQSNVSGKLSLVVYSTISLVWLHLLADVVVSLISRAPDFPWLRVGLETTFAILLTLAIRYFLTMVRAHISDKDKECQELFRKNPHPMWIYDLDTLKFLMVNEAAIALYGYTEKEFLAMTIKDIRPPEDGPLLISASEKRKLHFNHEFHWSGIWRHKVKSGNSLYVEISSHDILFEQKKAQFVMAYNITEKVLQDHKLQVLNQDLEQKVTERTDNLLQLNKRLVDQNRIIKSANLELYTVTNDLQEANKRIQEHADMKNRFVSMATHEFKNPLANILSSANFLKKYYHELQPEDVLHKTESIERHVTNMTALLSDMLTIGKNDASKLKPTLNQVKIEPFVRRIVDEVEIASKRSHRVNIALNNGIPPTINSDEKFLRNIFINLIGNAVKYSPLNKDVNVNVYAAGPSVCFEVIDNGVGIAPEDLEKIFEPFYRCNLTETIPGTGLGLSIVKRAAETLNAKLEVKSEVGKGTTFKVLIPC
jgi:PAS domain S-box-containing protein